MSTPTLKLSPAERVWARLARSVARASAAIEADLKAADLPPLAWYDALLALRMAGPTGLRPRDLEEALLLPQPNVSRLLDRMAREDLVVRAACPDDGRCQWIRITPAGRRLMKRMAPIYARAIQSAVGERLSSRDAAALAELLAPLAT